MVYIPRYLCDLHTHTTCSDGHDTPKELIDKAANIGMKIIAITDHDVRPAWSIIENNQTINIIKYAENKGIKLIRGIEISCDTDNEDVHIIGLGCEWNAAYFERLEKEVQKSRLKGYQELVKVLQKKGIDVTWDEILRLSGKEEQPELIHKKHIFEMIASKGYAKTWKEAKILVQNDPDLNIPRQKPDPITVIEEIHKAGGIAILAHPYLINEQVKYRGINYTRDQYIDLLIEASLDGIEACYSYDKTSYHGTMTKEAIEKEIKNKYGQKVSILSGGSDYHADYKKQMSNPRILGESGITLEYFYQNELLKNVVF